MLLAKGADSHAESSLESGDIKTPDANRIIEANIVYNVRTGEQLTRRRQNAKGFEELLDCAGVLFLENNQTGNLIINPPLSSIDDLMKYMQIDFLQPIYTLTFSNGLRGGHHTYIPYRQGNGPRCRFFSRSLHHRRCGRTYGFICITQAAHTEEHKRQSHRQGTEKKQDHIQTKAGS